MIHVRIFARVMSSWKPCIWAGDIPSSTWPPIRASLAQIGRVTGNRISYEFAEVNP